MKTIEDLLEAIKILPTPESLENKPDIWKLDIYPKNLRSYTILTFYIDITTVCQLNEVINGKVDLFFNKKGETREVIGYKLNGDLLDIPYLFNISVPETYDLPF